MNFLRFKRFSNYLIYLFGLISLLWIFGWQPAEYVLVVFIAIITLLNLRNYYLYKQRKKKEKYFMIPMRQLSSLNEWLLVLGIVALVILFVFFFKDLDIDIQFLKRVNQRKSHYSLVHFFFFIYFFVMLLDKDLRTHFVCTRDGIYVDSRFYLFIQWSELDAIKLDRENNMILLKNQNEVVLKLLLPEEYLSESEADLRYGIALKSAGLVAIE